MKIPHANGRAGHTELSEFLHTLGGVADGGLDGLNLQSLKLVRDQLTKALAHIAKLDTTAPASCCSVCATPLARNTVAAALGAMTSAKKARASRRNGKLGGRPSLKEAL